jgi:hypothetical protein
MNFALLRAFSKHANRDRVAFTSFTSQHCCDVGSVCALFKGTAQHFIGRQSRAGTNSNTGGKTPAHPSSLTVPEPIARNADEARAELAQCA